MADLPLCVPPSLHGRLWNVESWGVCSSHVADRNSLPASESLEPPGIPSSTVLKGPLCYPSSGIPMLEISITKQASWLFITLNAINLTCNLDLSGDLSSQAVISGERTQLFISCLVFIYFLIIFIWNSLQCLFLVSFSVHPGCIITGHSCFLGISRWEFCQWAQA